MSETAPHGPELSPTAHRVLGVVEGLDQFARQQYHEEIVDHNFTPNHERALDLPTDADGFTYQLDRLLDEIPDDEPNAEGLRRNLASTRLALAVMAGNLTIGKDLSYSDYVERVMGVRPALVPETVAEGGADSLEGQRRELEKTVEELGYHYDSDSRAAFSRAHNMPADQMVANVTRLIGTARQHTAKVFGHDLASGINDIDIQAVHDKDTWQGFFGTDEAKNFIMKINTNPLIKVSAAEELATIEHELGHGVSSTTKKRLIEAGELNGALGAVLTYSPAYFQDEVIARTAEQIQFMHAEQPFPRYVFQKLKYSNDVWHNMLFKANEEDWDETAVAAYADQHLPLEQPEKNALDAKLFKGRLVYKTVFAVDREAIRIGRQLAGLPHQERQAALAQLCSGPMVVADIVALGQPAAEHLAA